MNNATIIAEYKTLNHIPLEAPLLTASVWYNNGYQIKKGEKCKHRVTMWKHTTKTVVKDGKEEKSEKCFPKVMCLFESEQVEKRGIEK